MGLRAKSGLFLLHLRCSIYITNSIHLMLISNPEVDVDCYGLNMSAKSDLEFEYRYGFGFCQSEAANLISTMT